MPCESGLELQRHSLQKRRQGAGGKDSSKNEQNYGPFGVVVSADKQVLPIHYTERETLDGRRLLNLDRAGMAGRLAKYCRRRSAIFCTRDKRALYQHTCSSRGAGQASTAWPGSPQLKQPRGESTLFSSWLSGGAKEVSYKGGAPAASQLASFLPFLSTL